jgi:hypothetical protein
VRPVDGRIRSGRWQAGGAGDRKDGGYPARRAAPGRAGHPGPWGGIRPGTVAAGAALVLRLITAAGLGIDAYVHLRLAPTYAEAGGQINEGVLFRAEAALALAAALLIVLAGRRFSFLLGFAVSASALAVMLVARYVDLGALGPFPDLYDPVWFPEKLLAAFGEGAASVAALTGIFLASGHPNRDGSRPG